MRMGRGWTDSEVALASAMMAEAAVLASVPWVAEAVVPGNVMLA